MGDESNNEKSEKSLVLNTFMTSNTDFYEVDGSRPMVVFVRGHKPLGPSMRKEALTQIDKMASDEKKNVVFDFSRMEALGKEWNWVLVQLGKLQDGRGKKLAIANVSSSLKKYLCAQGLDSVAILGPDIASVCKSLGIEGSCQAKRSLNVELINPFLGSLIQVFEAHVNVKPEVGNAFLRKADSEALGDLCGVIEVDSPNLKGLVVFSFPMQTIQRFVSAVYGSEGASNSAFIRDSIGEITNIAFTRGKTELNAQGFGINGALPSTIEIEKLRDSFPAYGGPSITVPFKSSIGDFYAEIRLAG